MSEKDAKELEKKRKESEHSISELNQVVTKLEDVMKKIKEEQLALTNRIKEIHTQRGGCDEEIRVL
jgi:uncharacterized coiled-coil protein SlyX